MSRVYDVMDNGAIDRGRLFCVLKDERPGVSDGMKVDLEGNLYCTGPGGVWVIDPPGKHLGTIALGDGRRATNVGWGGDDWQTLFIITFHELACIRMKIPGVPVPRRLSTSSSWLSASRVARQSSVIRCTTSGSCHMAR
jgi:gluconolactonase